MTNDMKPKTAEELIALINENYEDIMEGSGTRFTPILDQGLKAEITEQNARLLKQLEDKPVLKHIVALHIQHGANFHGENSEVVLLKLMPEVKTIQQINAGIVGPALKADNYAGNPLEAVAYVGVGKG